MMRTRHVPAEWRARVLASDAWLLFVRAGERGVPDDVVSRRQCPGAARHPSGGESASGDARPPRGLSAQASLVELLQLLRYTRGVLGQARLRTPALGIVLTRWDELPGAAEGEGLPPGDLLRSNAPLLADYVEASWHPVHWFVVGLSSLGQALDPTHRDEAFVDRAPETQGYVVLPDGSRDRDLTLPVSMALERAGCAHASARLADRDRR